MAKSISKPILPANKRARCSNPAPYMTEGKLAFDIGRGGNEPPAWVTANAGMMARWQAGYKQRGRFVSAIKANGSEPRLTSYEKAQTRIAEAEKRAEDELLAKQMAQLKAVFAAQGIHLTRQALAAELRKQ